MDGNGRWARLRGKRRIYGHIRGATVARETIKSCARMGVQHLTLFAFSTENWLRPKEEVFLLMRILEKYLVKEQRSLMEQNIRFTAIGDLTRLPPDLRSLVQRTIQKTENNTGMNLIFAISYGSRSELTEAVKSIAHQVANGELRPEEIDESTLDMHLNSFPTPDLDLVIRTSGECRLSNFMLWQAAYAELYFDSILWPDFNEQSLLKAIQWFSNRDRRFGQVVENELALD